MNIREIYRGKDENGDWIEGFYAYEECSGTHYIFRNNQLGLWRTAIDPKTLGQHIGLLDCEDQKTFDGDIQEVEVYSGANVPDRWRCIVKWDIFYARWVLREINTGILIDPRDIAYKENIGNIHDNPELLK